MKNYAFVNKWDKVYGGDVLTIDKYF